MAFLGRPSQKDQDRALAYRQWLSQRHPFAIASFVLGVISLIEFGVLLIFGLAGIVLGVAALVQLRRPMALEGGGSVRPHGQRLAWTGIALSAISLVVAFLIYRLPPAK